MKKISLVSVILFVLLQVFVLYKPEKTLALADVDQGCSYGTTPEQITYLSHEPIQVFVPTKNRLEAVQVYVKAAIGTEANIRMEITSENHGTIAARTERVTNQWSWQLFEFSDIEMPMDAYGIKLTDSGDLGKSVWMHGPSGCYDRGYAIYDNVAHMEFDYRFAVNAHDADTPSTPADNSQTAPDTSGGTTNIGTSRGTGVAPAGSTSASIAAPTNLTATNESNYTGTGIRLNWTASNSNIDGYKIFRSNSASGGFTEIGRVISGVTIYLDSTVTVGQTYYYMVRAYKGNSESASSNVANANAKDTFKEDIVNSTKDDSGGIFGGGGLLFILARLLIPLLFFGLIFILLIVGIIILVRRRKNDQKTDNPPVSTEKKKE